MTGGRCKFVKTVKGSHAVQFLDLLGRKRMLKGFRHLALDAARTVAQDVFEGFKFAVYVGDKMLRALRQIEYRVQIDDFGGRRLYARKLFG